MSKRRTDPLEYHEFLWSLMAELESLQLTIAEIESALNEWQKRSEQ